MRLPSHQRVSDLLHSIAHLVYEADAYLRESDLFKSSVKPLPAPRSDTGIKPHKADGLTNRLRKMLSGGDERNILRAKRERDQRRRYQRKVKDAPRKSFGTRLRKR